MLMMMMMVMLKQNDLSQCFNNKQQYRLIYTECVVCTLCGFQFVVAATLLYFIVYDVAVAMTRFD